MDTIKAKLTSHFWQPSHKFWVVEGRRGNWHIGEYPNDVIDYSQIKYGTEESLRYEPESRVYYGKVVNRTDTEIEFRKITKKEAIKILRPDLDINVNWKEEGF